MNINYTKGGELKYKTVTFFGFVGLITGVKPVCLSLENHKIIYI